MTTTRRKVLLSAYACGPGRGSEPGLGWNALVAIARDHDVWVLTCLENWDAIQNARATLPASVQFVFVDWPKWLWFMKRTKISFEVQHYFWQIRAYFKARALHKQVQFDLTHHVTVARYWITSLLPFLGIPFVCGPHGGGVSAPKAFWPGLGVRGVIAEMVREVARFVGEHDPFLRLTARRTDFGIATNQETAARMLKLGVRRVEVSPQTVLSESEFAALDGPRASASGTIRFISSARLVAWKGVHLGLTAFARMPHTSAEYWIAGGGPEERSLKALARVLGVEDRVRFLGSLPRAEALQALLQCDVLVHPSLHDSCPWVCVEAMAAGLPVICVDLGGPGLQVTAETGFKVAAQRPEQVVQDMAAAMDALIESPTRRMAMGNAARIRAREYFNIGVMREQFRRCYEEVTGTHFHRQPEALATGGVQQNFYPSATPASSAPIVSAIMPTYNKGPWLQEAIDSVLAQTFTDWELILVDDGSTDATADVLARCSDPRIRIHRLAKNVGRSGARNVALGLARGRYIAICDSDDICVPTRFEEHVAFLDAHPEISVVSAHMQLLTDHRTARRIVFPIDHESIARRFARGKMGVAHGASMVRADCFQESGMYCEDLRAAEDFELFRRFSTRYRFQTLPRDLLLYRSNLGAVPFPVWTAASRAHRYALYRSKCQERSAPLLSFDEFVRSWRTIFLVYSVDSLRFAHFNLRAHVFSSHVLR